MSLGLSSVFAFIFTLLVIRKLYVLVCRVHGKAVAEMPLIATCSNYRRKGMCRRLMTAVEEVLLLRMWFLYSFVKLKANCFTVPSIGDIPRFSKRSFIIHFYVAFLAWSTHLSCVAVSAIAKIA